MTWRDEPALLPDRDYLVGIDLAQGGADWTALCVLQRTEPRTGSPAEYDVIHLERFRDRRAPRIIVERVAAIVPQIRAMHRDRILRWRQEVLGERPAYAEGLLRVAPATIRLVVDITGSGAFATDPLQQAGFPCTGIFITGGDAVSHPSSDIYRTPKRDLAGVVAVLLSGRRLRIAESLSDAAILRAELEGFRARISLSGHDTYESAGGEDWRAGSHDDLVLALAIACWVGEVEEVAQFVDPAIIAGWTDLPRALGDAARHAAGTNSVTIGRSRQEMPP